MDPIDSKKTQDLGNDRVFFRLVVVWPNGTSETFDVAQRPLSIGRADECTIQIREAKVSRRHCVVFARAGRLHLQDQGSSNGTQVNGNKVTQAQLRPGDQFRVGSVPIRIEVASVGGLYGVALQRARKSNMPEPPDDDTLSGSWGPTNLSLFNRVCSMMTRATDDQSASQAILDLLFELTALEQGVIMISGRSSESSELMAVATKNRGERRRFGPCMAVIDQVASQRKSICTFDVESDHALMLAGGEELEGVGVVLCAPLEYEDELIGIIYADASVTVKDLDLQVMTTFKSIAGQAGGIIGWARRYTEIIDRNKRLVAEQDKLRSHIIRLEKTLDETSTATQEQNIDLMVHLNELDTLQESRENTALSLVHDVRSMVDAMGMNLGRLDEVVDKHSDATRTVERLRHLSQRTSALTEDMLAVTQMENGTYGLSTELVEVTELLGATLERSRYIALAIGVRLKLGTVEPDLLAIADRNVAARVLDTFLGNALSLTEPGAEIILSASDDDSTVELVVTSTNSRSPEPWQASRKSTRSSSSSPGAIHGLGMLFCRLAADAHGGSVTYMTGRRTSRWGLELPARRVEEREDTLTQ